jgi:hypothetical protein
MLVLMKKATTEKALSLAWGRCPAYFGKRLALPGWPAW